MESLLVDGRTICLPFSSEDHYEQCMREPSAFRQFLTEMHARYSELFPRAMAQGFTLHSFTRPSRKLEGFRMRRIELTNGTVYQIRPSFVMPYLIARTEDVEKALFLCRWGVPFWALTYVFGHNDMFCYRAYISLGRNSIVGTTVKDPARMPEDLLADEKHTRLLGEKIFVATTVAKECILGVWLSESAGTEDLTRSFAHFKEEALNLNPDYQPKTVNTDGWEQRAWKPLFPRITPILCFLHAFLKIRDRCKRHTELVSPGFRVRRHTIPQAQVKSM